MKDWLRFVDNETLIIFSLSTVAICLIYSGTGELAMQIVNSIVSGFIGYMGRTRI
jgi:hypothetical protein